MGPSGERIMALEKSCGCRVQLLKPSETRKSPGFEICGNASNISATLHQMQTILGRSISYTTSFSSSSSSSLSSNSSITNSNGYMTSTSTTIVGIGKKSLPRRRKVTAGNGGTKTLERTASDDSDDQLSGNETVQAQACDQ